MRKITLIAVLSCLLFSSCLKDGFNDFDALRQPMSFHGQINPTLGVPIGEGSATVFDMINMVQFSTASMEIGYDSILTVTYDTNMSFHINLNESKHKGPAPKDDNIVHVAHRNIQGSVAVDLFDNIALLDTTGLEVDSLLVYLKAFVKASAEDSLNTINTIHDYHVQVYYDQLTLSVVGQDDLVYNILALDDSIPIVNLLHGEYITLFNNTDISTIINKRPKEIRYTARMNIAFEAAFFAMSGLSEDQFVADSIGIQVVDIDADLKARFPISAYINNLQYTVDINFSPSFRLDNLEIDSSMIFLDCFNGIPLALSIHALFVDENDNILCDVVNTEIDGAPVTLVNGHYIATGPKESLLEIPVTLTVYNALMNTAKIRLTAGVHTSEASNHRRVAIRANDELFVRAYAKIKPNYVIDIDFNQDSTETSKGGAQ